MLEPKRISSQSIPAAISKAEHYRLLNEPQHAESICLDVLQLEPHHQQAIVILVLALTDQFTTRFTEAYETAKDLVPKLSSDYERHYYDGIVNERWGAAQLARDIPVDVASGWLLEAMRSYELAEKLAEPSNPDPILRWNTCVRVLRKHSNDPVEFAPAQYDPRDIHEEYGDDVPLR